MDCLLWPGLFHNMASDTVTLAPPDLQHPDFDCAWEHAQQGNAGACLLLMLRFSGTAAAAATRRRT
jgi:hypothetical protein